MTFGDAADAYDYSVDGAMDMTRKVASMSDSQLANFFERPIKITTLSWEVGSPLTIRFNPWNLFMENPRVINRLANFNLLQTRLCVKFVVNGNQFYFGRAIASYTPLDNVDDFAAASVAPGPQIILESQKPHIYLDPKLSRGATLCLPFVWYLNALNIPISQWREMGHIDVSDISSPLRHANGATESIEISVFVWTEGLEIDVPTSNDPDSIVPQMGDENPVTRKELTHLYRSMRDDIHELGYTVRSLQNHKEKLIRYGDHLNEWISELQTRVSRMEGSVGALLNIDLDLDVREPQLGTEKPVPRHILNFTFHELVEELRCVHVMLMSAPLLDRVAHNSLVNYKALISQVIKKYHESEYNRYREDPIQDILARNIVAPQMGDEYGMGPISRPATAVGKAASKLTDVPWIGPYAMATQMVASTTAYIAALFGYSRPAVLQDIVPYTPRYVGNLASVASPDPVNTLATDPKQNVTIDPTVVGIGSADEMTVKSIACRESYVSSFRWEQDVTTETLLFQISVSPVLWDTTPGVGNQVDSIYLTASGFASLPFQNWKGTMRYRFQVVTSNFHRGRLKFVYEPSAFNTNEYNTNYTRVVDIANEMDFTIEIGWGIADPFITLAEPGNAGAGGGVPPFSSTPFLGLRSPFDNGVLRCLVVNELTTPNSAVTTNGVDINVFASCGEDCMFANPRNAIDNYSYFNLPQLGEERHIDDIVSVDDLYWLPLVNMPECPTLCSEDAVIVNMIARETLRMMGEAGCPFRLSEYKYHLELAARLHSFDTVNFAVSQTPFGRVSNSGISCYVPVPIEPQMGNEKSTSKCFYARQTRPFHIRNQALRARAKVRRNPKRYRLDSDLDEDLEEFENDFAKGLSDKRLVELHYPLYLYAYSICHPFRDCSQQTADYLDMDTTDVASRMFIQSLKRVAFSRDFVPKEREVQPQMGEETPMDTDHDAEPVRAPSESVDHVVSNTMDSTDNYKKVFFGEEIESFRSLLKRYNLLEAVSFSAITLSRRVTRISNAFPRLSGFAPNGEFTASGQPYNATHMTLMNYLTPAYVCRRGGIRYKSYLINGNNVSPSYFSVNRLPNGANTSTNVVNLTNAATALVSEFRFNQPLGNAGQNITPPLLNPVLEFEVPYQTPNRFSFARKADLSTDNFGENAYELNVVNPVVDVTSFGAIVNYVAAAEDFSLGFYIGPPPIHFTPDSVPIS